MTVQDTDEGFSIRIGMTEGITEFVLLGGGLIADIIGAATIWNTEKVVLRKQSGSESWE